MTMIFNRPEWCDTASIDWIGGARILTPQRVLLAGSTKLGAQRYGCNSVLLRDIEDGVEEGSVLAFISELAVVRAAIATKTFALRRTAVLERGDHVMGSRCLAPATPH